MLRIHWHAGDQRPQQHIRGIEKANGGIALAAIVFPVTAELSGGLVEQPVRRAELADHHVRDGHDQVAVELRRELGLDRSAADARDAAVPVKRGQARRRIGGVELIKRIVKLPDKRTGGNDDRPADLGHGE